MYLAIVVGVGTLVGSRGNQDLFLSIVATAVIAVAFQPATNTQSTTCQPARSRRTSQPHEVLSEFTRRMAGAATDDSLQQMASSGGGDRRGASDGVAPARRAAAAASPLAPERAASQPIPLVGNSPENALVEMQDGSRSFPVGHQEELLGTLTKAASPRGPLTPPARSSSPTWPLRPDSAFASSA